MVLINSGGKNHLSLDGYTCTFWKATYIIDHLNFVAVVIMICIVYISSAKFKLSEREIVSIVNASRLNNERLGITGILLYNSGNFMQLIEGNEEEIEALYEKIRKDNRHTGVTRLLKETIPHRNFDRWVMGYRNLETLKNLDPEVLSPFMDEELNFPAYKESPFRALHFLEMFKKIIA